MLYENKTSQVDKQVKSDNQVSSHNLTAQCLNTSCKMLSHINFILTTSAFKEYIGGEPEPIILWL